MQVLYESRDNNTVLTYRIETGMVTLSVYEESITVPFDSLSFVFEDIKTNVLLLTETNILEKGE